MLTGALALLCTSAGFTCFQRSALLSDLTVTLATLAGELPRLHWYESVKFSGHRRIRTSTAFACTLPLRAYLSLVMHRLTGSSSTRVKIDSYLTANKGPISITSFQNGTFVRLFLVVKPGELNPGPFKRVVEQLYPTRKWRRVPVAAV